MIKGNHPVASSIASNLKILTDKLALSLPMSKTLLTALSDG